MSRLSAPPESPTSKTAARATSPLANGHPAHALSPPPEDPRSPRAAEDVDGDADADGNDADGEHENDGGEGEGVGSKEEDVDGKTGKGTGKESKESKEVGEDEEVEEDPVRAPALVLCSFERAFFADRVLVFIIVVSLSWFYLASRVSKNHTSAIAHRPWLITLRIDYRIPLYSLASTYRPPPITHRFTRRPSPIARAFLDLHTMHDIYAPLRRLSPITHRFTRRPSHALCSISTQHTTYMHPHPPTRPVSDIAHAPYDWYNICTRHICTHASTHHRPHASRYPCTPDICTRYRSITIFALFSQYLYPLYTSYSS